MQQWMCEHVLGITPATEDEKPPPRRTHADKWPLNHQAAKQYYQREGHLRVPRKHSNRSPSAKTRRSMSSDSARGSGTSGSRAATLTPERVEQLYKIGMRWA
ncbi:hypothetical protein GCM10010232_66410 [Streptomyces amakusaensis]|uniref:Helicase associated domain-containing protein n=1 Tax=Streptomyces amakusaensis TaxID=67271 RepID=A0ABW0AVM1_9ACTN